MINAVFLVAWIAKQDMPPPVYLWGGQLVQKDKQRGEKTQNESINFVDRPLMNDDKHGGDSI